MDLLSGFMARCTAQTRGRILPTQTLTVGQQSCQVSGGAMMITNALRDAGLWEKVTNTILISNSDFARLGIADRVICTLGAKGIVKTMKVMLIENDPGDSDVTVHLQLAHASP